MVASLATVVQFSLALFYRGARASRGRLRHCLPSSNVLIACCRTGPPPRTLSRPVITPPGPWGPRTQGLSHGLNMLECVDTLASSGRARPTKLPKKLVRPHTRARSRHPPRTPSPPSSRRLFTRVAMPSKMQQQYLLASAVAGVAAAIRLMRRNIHSAKTAPIRFSP